ncbi:MAG: hypothetical protein HYW63_03495 [Candidatus Levybacteria bacterium]|nr:hypothetical protein [Candidatus Levybacteria bacterium]
MSNPENVSNFPPSKVMPMQDLRSALWSHDADRATRALVQLDRVLVPDYESVHRERLLDPLFIDEVREMVAECLDSARRRKKLGYLFFLTDATFSSIVLRTKGTRLNPVLSDFSSESVKSRWEKIA